MAEDERGDNATKVRMSGSENGMRMGMGASWQSSCASSPTHTTNFHHLSNPFGG
jgi:hypothetical protein